MGINLKDIVEIEETEVESLGSRKIAIDALNSIYQFLSVIRRHTGEPLKDSEGRITSHLSGLFYRTTKLIDNEIRICYVFDGEPPDLKSKTSKKRRERRKEARKKYEKALKEGDVQKAKKYAQQSVSVQEQMIDQSKDVLDAMGVPYVQAPSEGEAQASYMCDKGDVWGVGSQDFDAILFGAPILVRNLNITGKRKLPGKKEYKQIKPELVRLDKTIQELGISQEKLIWLAILVGTDFNPSGVSGLGPKRALKKVKKFDSYSELIDDVDWESDNDPNKILNFFKNPPLNEDYSLEWKEPQPERIRELLCEKHDFSENRINNGIEKLKNKAKSRQSRLDSF